MPLNYALPISVSPVGASYVIEGKAEDFVILPPINPMSQFEDDYAWVDLEDGSEGEIISNQFSRPKSLILSWAL